MSVSIDLKGKTALVTGANGGIGSSIVSILMEAGANCICIDSPSSLNDFKPTKNGNESKMYIEADFTKKFSIDEIRKKLKNKNIQVDIVVNSAGYTEGNDFFNYSELAWEKTIKINLTTPFLISQMLAKEFMSNGGCIINITSLAAEQGFPGNVAYVSSKGALKQLTKAMAIDLSEFNIRVNSIGPGYVKTKMTERSWNDSGLRNERSRRMISKRWAEPKDIANAVLFLASDMSEYINGQSIYVDGGWLSKGL